MLNIFISIVSNELRDSTIVCSLLLWLVRATAPLSDTTAMQQMSWCQCCCGLPQYFAHTSNSFYATAGRRCKWILTHNLTLIVPVLSHHCSDRFSWNVHGSVYSTFIFAQRCIFQYGSIRLALFWIRALCCLPFCQKSAPAVFWAVILLQQSCMRHKIGPVPFFPHT